MSKVSTSWQDVETSDGSALGVSGQGNDALSPVQATMDNVSGTGCPPTVVSSQKDAIAWYPMRIAYTQDATTLKIRDFLTGKNVEVFLPVEMKVTRKDGKIHKRLAPMFNSLIFIHDTQNEITRLKRSHRELLSLRYYMRHFSDEYATIPRSGGASGKEPRPCRAVRWRHRPLPD